ncbi:unnamed protein product [Fraxinus pennsylvanica]|uniref:Uncharacterized protein n=1 Tax=Fraxinus pennsylvanica TaxID=56036 RepID=A0AAD1ZQJ3_9LAMI|nr:unnamed protein product [Fraxinus pennsylvanica]
MVEDGDDDAESNETDDGSKKDSTEDKAVSVDDDIRAWSVVEVLRPLYESSKLVAQNMTITALQYIRQIAQETNGEVVYGLGRQPAVLHVAVVVNSFKNLSIDTNTVFFIGGILSVKASMLLQADPKTDEVYALDDNPSNSFGLHCTTTCPRACGERFA